MEPEELTISEKQEAFLSIIEAHGLPDTEAAELVGVHRITAWRWKQDPAFLPRYKEARKVCLEKLIKEAERRAMSGSDRLLEFLLCNYAPDKFSNKQKVEHAGEIGIAERLARARNRTTESPTDGSDLAG